jgi:outer membrane protein assembly factor BamE (lipoprotein component of BamABCDE complex)
MQGLSKLVGYLRISAVAGVALVVAGCSAPYQNHGYAPSDDALAGVIVGVDSRQNVADVIGRPTALGVLSDTGWYYARSRWRHFAFKEPEIIERQLVAITFDSKGIVENVERFTLADGRVVPLSRRVTDSNIKGVTFLRQLLGNLGRLSADSLIQ